MEIQFNRQLVILRKVLKILAINAEYTEDLLQEWNMKMTFLWWLHVLFLLNEMVTLVNRTVKKKLYN